MARIKKEVVLAVWKDTLVASRVYGHRGAVFTQGSVDCGPKVALLGSRFRVRHGAINVRRLCRELRISGRGSVSSGGAVSEIERSQGRPSRSETVGAAVGRDQPRVDEPAVVG